MGGVQLFKVFLTFYRQRRLFLIPHNSRGSVEAFKLKGFVILANGNFFFFLAETDCERKIVNAMIGIILEMKKESYK